MVPELKSVQTQASEDFAFSSEVEREGYLSANLNTGGKHR
jgi:hypothetical protein